MKKTILKRFGERLVKEDFENAGIEKETISNETLEEMNEDLSSIIDEMKLSLKSFNDWKNVLKNFTSDDTEQNNSIDDIFLLLEQTIDNSENDLKNIEKIRNLISEYKKSGDEYLQ